jgi:Na+/melibiose symporter-like transporter
MNGKVMKKSEVFSYGGSLFGMQILVFFVISYSAEFFRVVMGAELWIIGILLLIARTASAVFDPIVGNMIEKKKGKFGKFKPFIAVSLPLIFVSTILLFVDFRASGTGMYVLAFILLTVFSFATTLGDVPSNAIGAVLTPYSEERTGMLAKANILRSVGQSLHFGIVAVICIILSRSFDILTGGYEMNDRDFLVSGIVIAVIGTGFFALALRAKERVPYKAERISFRQMFGILKNNKPLLLVVLSMLLGFARTIALPIQMQSAMVLFHNANLTILAALPAGMGALLSMIFIPVLIKKFDVKKVYIGFCLYGFVAAIINFFVVIAIGYTDILWLFIIIQFFYGMQFGSLNIPLILVADSVDYYEHKTGKRTEGVSFGIFGLTFKIAVALMTALGLIMVSLFGYDNFDVDLAIAGDPQMAAIRQGVWFTRIIIPGISALLSVIPILFYNLVGNKKKQICEELNARRQNAELGIRN